MIDFTPNHGTASKYLFLCLLTIALLVINFSFLLPQHCNLAVLLLASNSLAYSFNHYLFSPVCMLSMVKVLDVNGSEDK